MWYSTVDISLTFVFNTTNLFKDLLHQSTIDVCIKGETISLEKRKKKYQTISINPIIELQQVVHTLELPPTRNFDSQKPEQPI